MARISAPSGFTIGECLRERLESRLYAATDLRTDRAVAIKFYLDSRDSLRAEARLRFEVGILERLAAVGVPQVLDQLAAHRPPACILSALPTRSLAMGPEIGSRVSAVEILEIAVQLSMLLGRVHALGLLYGSLSPDRVLLDTQSLQCHLADFEGLQVIGERQGGSVDSCALDHIEDLRYSAPEFSGRMNRGCDARSDLYSLGCLLYYIVSGRAPFVESDPLALVHAHMARTPRSLRNLRPDLPETLYRIVDKLLSKEPSDRYQSAAGLQGDLSELRDQIRLAGTIRTLAMEELDAGRAPRFSGRIYGRETEIESLLQGYLACEGGVANTFVIRGARGIGKTSLVSEFSGLVRERGGTVGHAIRDPSDRHPLAPWIAAIESLVGQHLLADDRKLSTLSRTLHDQLGDLAGTLVEVVPELRIILGEVDPVPPLGANRTRARLSIAIERFVRAAAMQEFPVVLVLDEIDSTFDESLALLRELPRTATSSPLMLIAVFSCEERSSAGQPHSDGQERARFELGSTLIELGPLSATAAREMIAEALAQPPERVAALQDTLSIMTGNSPDLIRQLIAHLHDRGLLWHEHGAGWRWDLGRIQRAKIPDGASGMIAARLDGLDPMAREVASLASIVGDAFRPGLLAEIAGSSRDRLSLALDELVARGLIVRVGARFRFTHPAVRENAARFLDADRQARAHARLGTLMYEGLTENPSLDELCTTLDHLCRGGSDVQRDHRVVVISLSLAAAQQSLATGDVNAASLHLAEARSRILEADWRAHPDLCRSVLLTSVESDMESGSYEEALSRVEWLGSLVASPEADPELTLVRLRILPMIQHASVCVPSILEVLRRYGISWPERPSLWRTRISLLRTNWMLWVAGEDAMRRAVSSRDDRARALLAILAVSGPSMLLHDIRLAALASALGVRLCIRSGASEGSAYRLAVFTAYSYVLLGNPGLARRRSEMALEWNQHEKDPILSRRTEHLIYSLVQPWLDRRRTAIVRIVGVSEKIREAGDPEYHQYARFVALVYRALAGDPIPETDRRFERFTESMAGARPWNAEVIATQKTYALLVSGTAGQDLARLLLESRDQLSGDAPYLSTMWMMVLCFSGRYDLAFSESERIADRLFRCSPFVHVADHTFYRGISAGRLASSSRSMARRRYRRVLKNCIRKLRWWSRGGPDFAHMAVLLSAEAARIGRSHGRALKLYSDAARHADSSNFPHHAALAHEYRAELLESQHLPASAEWRRATEMYERWGAHRRVASPLQGVPGMSRRPDPR